MLAFIGVTILMVVNLVIYHKIFNVLYFDLGKGLLKEVVGAYIAACIEAGLIVMVGEKLLGGLLGVLGWLIRLILIIVAVIIVIGIVVWITKMIKGKMEDGGEKTDEMTSGSDVEPQKAYSQEKGNVQKKVCYCTYCGKTIEETSMFCNFCGKEKWHSKNN